jgi:ankyrin repeat protein
MLCQECSDVYFLYKKFFLFATPLQIAVSQNHFQNVLVLLHKVADANLQNKTGNTPLHFCTRISNLGIAQALIAGGSKITTKNIHGQPPFSSANHYKNEELKAYLLRMRDKAAERPLLEAMVQRSGATEAGRTRTPLEEEDLNPGMMQELMDQIAVLEERISALHPKALEELPPAREFSLEELADRMTALVLRTSAVTG